jgi:hypothetical protein
MMTKTVTVFRRPSLPTLSIGLSWRRWSSSPIVRSLFARALRTEAAARFISVDPETMVQWRREGKGPIFKKLGSRCIYLVESLDRFLDGLPIGNKNAVARTDA